MSSVSVPARTTIGVLALLTAFSSIAFCQQPIDPDVHRLFVPGKSWALDIDLTGFSTSAEELMTDARSTLGVLAAINTQGQFDQKGATAASATVILRAMPRSSGLDHFAILSISLAPAQNPGGAEALRAFAMDEYTKSKRVSKGRMKTSEHNQVPLLTYSVAGQSPNDVAFPVFNGAPRRGMEAYIARDDIWITIGFTAQPFNEKDEKQFYSVLDSAKITDTSTPVSSFDYSQLGHALLHQKEYLKAVGALSRAIEIEQQKRQLSLAQWRSLVEDVTDAYGAVGNRTGAKEVLEYGISNDPDYPTFHLGLARLYASYGDLDNTLASLQKAFLSAKNERRDKFDFRRLPDPMNDAAFAVFQKEPRFREAVKAMKKLH